MSSTTVVTNTSTPVVDKEIKPQGAVTEAIKETVGQLSSEEVKTLLEFAGKIKDDPNYTPLETKSNEEVKKEFITDFSNISEDQIYDLELVEARPFMSADILEAKLKDSNYVARWVNKTPQRLNSMLAMGFRYVFKEDLQSDLNISVAKDAEGHFAYNDVVLMRIPKAIYFPALKAAQLRAENATRQIKSGEIGKNHAMSIMQKEGGSAFGDAYKAGKINFYTPPIEA